MLKIKADRMKDLEKFGFKKFYDCSTGELLRYYLEFGKQHVIRLQVDITEKLYFEPYILIISYFDFDRYCDEYKDKTINAFIDFIFDLTQAGIVEKVVEDE